MSSGVPGVVALYVDPRGPYPALLGAYSCWDEARDARMYCGPFAVVAHPPCGPWGALRHLQRQDVRDCALRAVEQVRAHGGVLEHPAGSKLWGALGLPLPDRARDAFGGFTVEVDQCAWGHVARKRTWVYCIGVDAALVRAGIRTGGTVTHWVSGGRNPARKGRGGLVPPGIKVCSAPQRRRSPRAFAEWLISLAGSVSR